MSRATFVLSNRDRRAACAALIANIELGAVVEVKADKRTVEQNRALHEIIGQVLKQRPTMHGARMSKEAYKAVFMHALGRETPMLPNLEGTGYFPVGLSTSKLTVREFTDLIEFILAWCAREGLTITHFDADDRGEASNTSPRRERAA